MTDKLNDGGPAFPGDLRDWFAGQALAGLLTNEGYLDNHVDRAEFAYTQADAMLAAREK